MANLESYRVSAVRHRSIPVARVLDMALVIGLVLCINSPSNAQILPLKRQETAAEQPNPTGDARTPDSPIDDAGPGEDAPVPPWERRFIQVLDSIDEAITVAEKSLKLLENFTENPLVKRDELERIRRGFGDAVGTPALNLHMELADIRPQKSINNRKQFFLLVLRAPDFPADAFFAEIKVAISPAEARRLMIGSVVRLRGQLMQGTRTSFGTIYFHRQAGQRPRIGSEQIGLREPPRPTSLGGSYVFPFFVENVQVLAGNPLEEYREFKARFEQRLSATDVVPEGSQNTDATSEQHSLNRP